MLLYDCIYMTCPEQKIYRDTKQMSGCQGQENLGEVGSDCSRIKMFWYKIEMIFAQYCVYAQHH